MEVDLIFKIAAIGILVAVLNQVLSRAGRDEQAMMTTLTGGSVNIVVTGSTGEGDGIDSNGWLVINGGTVTASACGFSGDSGIDSDMGIHVNGGTVIASGNMLDRLEEGGQNYAVFTFASTQAGGSTYALKNAAGDTVAEYAPANDFSILVVSAPELTAGEYTFWQGETQLAASSGMGGGFGGGKNMMPGSQRPEDMENMTPPEGMENMERPERGKGSREEVTMNEDGTITLPDGTSVDPSQMERPQGGQGSGFGGRGQGGGAVGEVTTTFTIVDGANYFSGITAAE